NDAIKPSVADVDPWMKSIRAFAATHGPQFESYTLGRFASAPLIRHLEYADLARKLAADADQLAVQAGLAPEHVKSVAAWDEERAAWASQTNPPAADAVWTVTINGKVTDAEGGPIADADVLVNSLQWVKVLWQDGSNKTKSGPDGRYSITLKCLGVYRAHVTKMWAEKSGLVRTYDSDRHKLLPGQSATVDFVLKPGEKFGGTLKLLPTSFEREHPDLEQMLEVKGAGVWELIQVQNRRKFELILPPGAYTVELHRGHNNLTWAGLKSGTTDHVFEEPAFQFTPETVGAAFDEMWKSMDRNYSYFTLKPDIDWVKLRDEYRPKAIKAKSADELAAVLKEMLGRLQDGHVWIMKPGGEQIGTHRVVWSQNGNRKVVLDQLTDRTECGQFAIVGQTKPDGFGYFFMTRQSAATPELVKKAVAAIEKLADAPGFIIDLRNANGGNELLAQEIARIFCEKKVVYAKSKYRNGPGHDDFTEDYPRELPPAKSGKPYVKPVVCLLGPGCVSSGEGFAKMLAALPHVTTVGLPTRGSSGNPGPVEVGGTGLTVYFSRWVDMLPNGTPIEGKGVPPKVRVDVAAEAYKDADPTLSKGLELLRSKTAPPR
ncbi:MAG TPA: S41 family peptidase, partial [Gemmataceae bacterium]|nr:S41 family peptidase [Gemmataceae bacterium]